MALHFQTLKTRALSAAIFVAVMLLGLLWNHWTFFFLFSIIHFGCWIEYQKLTGLIDARYTLITPVHRYGVVFAGWCLMLLSTNDAYNIGNISLHELGWWLTLTFMFALPVIELMLSREVILKNIGYSAFGIIYLSASWALMIDMRNLGLGSNEPVFSFDGGRTFPCLLIFSVWINDTMAYIVGSLAGKNPLSGISPNKTWEGTVGGALLGMSVMAFAGSRLTGASTTDALIVAAIAAVAGTAGDLLESKMKRMARVKDSGQMMPGHGGFLDRFDSLLLATPLVWCYVKFFAAT